jgi:hypothetical protein
MDINNNAKVKMELVFMKLSSVWPVPLLRSDENDETQSKRGLSGQKGSKSRGGSSNKGSSHRNTNQAKTDGGSERNNNSDDDPNMYDNEWGYEDELV